MSWSFLGLFGLGAYVAAKDAKNRHTVSKNIDKMIADGEFKEHNVPLEVQMREGISQDINEIARKNMELQELFYRHPEARRFLADCLISPSLYTKGYATPIKEGRLGINRFLDRYGDEIRAIRHKYGMDEISGEFIVQPPDYVNLIDNAWTKRQIWNGHYECRVIHIAKYKIWIEYAHIDFRGATYLELWVAYQRQGNEWVLVRYALPLGYDSVHKFEGFYHDIEEGVYLPRSNVADEIKKCFEIT